MAELNYLKTGYAFKLYWLLSEYRTFGTCTFTIDELRFRLGLKDDEYVKRFDNFKAEVLNKAQGELVKTNLAFKIKLLRKARKVHKIRFTFKAQLLLLEAADEAEPVELPPLVAVLTEALVPEPWMQHAGSQRGRVRTDSVSLS